MSRRAGTDLTEMHHVKHTSDRKLTINPNYCSGAHYVWALTVVILSLFWSSVHHSSIFFLLTLEKRQPDFGQRGGRVQYSSLPSNGALKLLCERINAVLIQSEFIYRSNTQINATITAAPQWVVLKTVFLFVNRTNNQASEVQSQHNNTAVFRHFVFILILRKQQKSASNLLF